MIQHGYVVFAQRSAIALCQNGIDPPEQNIAQQTCRGLGRLAFISFAENSSFGLVFHAQKYQRRERQYEVTQAVLKVVC